MEKIKSSYKTTASKIIFAALNILKDNNCEMPWKELLKEIENKVEFTDWEKERYEKSGSIRWQTICGFYTMGCVKAGYLIKKNGIWYLTPEGIEAIKEGEKILFENMIQGYKNWENNRNVVKINDDEETEIEENEEILTFANLSEKAIDGMSDYINKKNPYEFQDLISALLRGMGYYTTFIAPKGKDGGVDIIAYKDPLGTSTPRIQVQV